jgi:hypothetical protein
MHLNDSSLGHYGNLWQQNKWPLWRIKVDNIADNMAIVVAMTDNNFFDLPPSNANPLGARQLPNSHNAQNAQSGCRFILGDPLIHPWAYCRARRQSGSAFCAKHHALCHRPPSALEAAELKRLLGRTP